GGAGIQCDLKTFTVLGVFGTSAITALTAQNTCGVRGIHAVPAAFVRQQIDAVVSDIGADAVKTGMLASADTVHAVASAIRDHHIQQLVVDPVMAAQSGAELLPSEAREALLRELLPLASLVTPNIEEAQVLTGCQIVSVDDMREAARALVAAGAGASLVTGGHLEAGEAIDVFHDGHELHRLAAPRLPVRHTHGSGCQLSAAVAAHLARGCALPAAVEGAKRFITVALRHGLAIGRGTGPANPLAWLEPGARSSPQGARITVT
ncbi:MAG: bifunctional hydroxymethylpyrimidine kinase/phosphomethylpyrimidine kinase, partial [Candidatus Binatia bacterium]